MTTTFNTSKELAKYVKIETEYWYRKDCKELLTTKEVYDNIAISFINCYPAPTLEELLGASPIEFTIEVHAGYYLICRNFRYEKMGVISDQLQIFKSMNITEEVAKIILEYYKTKSDL